MSPADVRERVTPSQGKSGCFTAVVTELPGTSHEVIRGAKCKMLEASGNCGKKENLLSYGMDAFFK